MANRKPTTLLELNGAFKRNPGRRRGPEPFTGELGDPPARLPADVVPYWLELISLCAPGVLQRSDRWCVELAARLMEKAARGPIPQEVVDLVHQIKVDTTAADKLKALLLQDGITATELQTLRSLLAAMGMTPADRSRLSAPVQKKRNPFEDLAAQGRKLQQPN